MKNIGILIVALIILLTACGKNETTSDLNSGQINYKFQENVKEPHDLIEVVYFKSEVTPGSYGEIVARGKPDTEYSIKVIYDKTESKSKGLVTKTADKNGIVSWSWKTGAKTKPGTYKVEITQGAELVVSREFKLI